MVAVATYAHAQDSLQLGLQKALQLAKENNKLLQIQQMEEKVAQVVARETKGSLLPTVGIQGSYQYFFDRQVIFMPGSFVGNESKPVVDVAVGGTNALSTQVYLQQPVLNEAMRRQIKGSNLDVALQRQHTRGTEANVIAGVTENYYSILLLQASLGLHRQSMERNLQALNDSRTLFHQGKALKVDTLRNYIAVQNLQSAIYYLTSELEVRQLTMKNQLGIAANAKVVITDSLYFHAPSAQQIQLTTDEMLNKRPDVLQSQLSVSKSQSIANQQKALRLPTLHLVGAYQLQAQADNRQLENYRWPRTSFIGLQANVPLFAGFRTESKIRQAQWRVKQSQTALQHMQEKAITEKATLENELSEAMRQAELQQQTVEAAALSYRMTLDRYKNGLSSRLELSDAELSLTTAKMNELNATYRVLVTKLHLEKALGLLTF